MAKQQARAVAHFDETFRVPYATDITVQRTRVADVVRESDRCITVVIDGRTVDVPWCRVLLVDRG